MSRNNREEVNQAGVGSGNNRASTLTFRSYQQSQGGQYECSVNVSGNYTERLAVCIGERYTFLLTVKSATTDSGVLFVPSINLPYHLYYVHTIQISTL